MKAFGHWRWRHRMAWPIDGQSCRRRAAVKDKDTEIPVRREHQHGDCIEQRSVTDPKSIRGIMRP